MLSLGGNNGGNDNIVDVRFVQLKKYKKCRCIFQPKAEGFFKDGMEIVNLDLRGILEKQLQFHTCLTEGDVVPIQDGKKDYYYVEKKKTSPQT